MRAVIQRVSEASVTVNGSVVGAIGHGLLILLGVTQTDTLADVDLLAEKIAHLRIFGDHEGKFNLSLIDVGGAALVVSQFTLYADTRKGRRPSFTAAARPEIAEPLVDAFADALRARAIPVATGVFGAMMHVALINDGPVTIVIDSAELRLPRRSN
ncbi:D-aminoacyl-tRNA deacylase [uncultured Chloroflexus sp.]|uniref:D-aminoacyl-tRNA deacylase n=1 Tax=uncultured Chloroflexus sp. TaxID=214040 RepID=UPI00262BDB11|nr:D-aminoacyl-tRNA deacylase [uncultured Chloroflexus sp.]